MTTIGQIFTEKQVCEFLNCKKSQLDNLRQSRCLPFIKVSNTIRRYHEPSLVEWMENNITVLNRGTVVLEKRDDEQPQMDNRGR